MNYFGKTKSWRTSMFIKTRKSPVLCILLRTNWIEQYFFFFFFKWLQSHSNEGCRMGKIFSKQDLEPILFWKYFPYYLSVGCTISFAMNQAWTWSSILRYKFQLKKSIWINVLLLGGGSSLLFLYFHFYTG